MRKSSFRGRSRASFVRKNKKFAQEFRIVVRKFTFLAQRRAFVVREFEILVRKFAFRAREKRILVRRFRILVRKRRIHERGKGPRRLLTRPKGPVRGWQGLTRGSKRLGRLSVSKDAAARQLRGGLVFREAVCLFPVEERICRLRGKAGARARALHTFPSRLASENDFNFQNEVPSPEPAGRISLPSCFPSLLRISSPGRPVVAPLSALAGCGCLADQLELSWPVRWRDQGSNWSGTRLGLAHLQMSDFDL